MNDSETLPPARQARFAFLVVEYPDGRCEALPDCDTPVQVEQAATLVQIKKACEHIGFEIGANLAAELVVRHNLMAARAMQEQQANENIRSKLII